MTKPTTPLLTILQRQVRVHITSHLDPPMHSILTQYFERERKEIIEVRQMQEEDGTYNVITSNIML